MGLRRKQIRDYNRPEYAMIRAELEVSEKILLPVFYDGQSIFIALFLEKIFKNW